MIDQNIIEVCRAYAALICASRTIYAKLWPPGEPRAEGPNYVTCLRRAARELYNNAPHEALAYLDIVKKVLEIDETVTTVSVVLLRASLISEDRQRWAMPGDAPSDPDAGSDLIPMRP